LTVEGQSYDTLESVIGISALKEMELNNGARFVPELRVSWRHEFLNEIQINRSSFSGGGDAFVTQGFDPANDTFNIGLSATIQLHDKVDLRFNYDFDAKSDYSSHSGLINLRYSY